MTLGVFGGILALGTRERPIETVDDLAGLARRQPAAALAMALCLFSLAGIPRWPASGASRVVRLGLPRDADRGCADVPLCRDRGPERRDRAYYYLRIVVSVPRPR
jgi:NADH-quinone oxidoreductase subunit N